MSSPGASLLELIGFRDRTSAARRLESTVETLPPAVRTRVEVLMAGVADPDSTLYYLDALRARHPDAFLRLTHSNTCLQYLAALFSSSRFLSDEVLQHPEWIDEFADSGLMHRALSAAEYTVLLTASLGSLEVTPAPLALALFRRKQLTRILLRDVLGYALLAEVTAEISALADAILEVAVRGIRGDLVRRFGTPLCPDADGVPHECGFAVLALGKLGGKELNYSSDIDLMFLYEDNGETDGHTPITNKEFFKKLSNTCTDLLSTYTAGGLCYRVDLRLRPDGRLGEVCHSLDAARHYYVDRARDWELQMLIKARVAAGDRGPGRALLEFVDPLTYATTLDFSAVESVSATRERIHEKLAARRTGSGLDVKLAPGGIRDIEFLVQCLQRLHGGREPWVRHGGTLLALSRLYDKELLSDAEYSGLSSAYIFLRNLEHRLQALDDLQTHSLPTSEEDLELLARRMPRDGMSGAPTAERLRRQLNSHLEEVQALYERVIHAQKPSYYMTSPVSVDEPAPVIPLLPEPLPSNLVRFLDEKAPRLAAQLSQTTLRRGAATLEHFLERIDNQPARLAWLNEDPILTTYVLELIEHSPHLSEQLIRKPEMLEEVYAIRHRPNADGGYQETAALLDDPAELRRFFRRESWRLQAASICLRAPIFQTLERMSALADATIAAAYRIAVASVTKGAGPQDGGMMVIALGRLGLHEFDLASDADLVFVVRDEDAGAEELWTRVAEKLIQILTAYTGEGVLFAVDTRLRPNGREGALVQSESTFKEYFAHRAEAWEGITYMKSRAVAGDIERGTAFLGELQKVDWRRYGQSGRSKHQLHDMRVRLEKEQGAMNPLKAGFGGYYDIDFALMYLRLKGAGIFFKVLNTPERIEVIEQMGHLEPGDAEFLRDAATFYRALDHGLRIISGHAEGSLPSSSGQLQLLAELVARWTPGQVHDRDLALKLSQIQRRTRALFERLFQ
jgi:glutamate-ammonia-ligase adenylyltransferase